MTRERMAYRCSNSTCACEVSAPSGACGNLCRDRAMASRAAEGELVACGCGHPDCYRDADWKLAPEFED